MAKGRTTREFCTARSPADSRNRSASIESNPVVRFSVSAAVAGKLAAASPGMVPVSMRSAFIMVLRPSRTSAADAVRVPGFFSRQAMITLFSSGEIPGTISLKSGGSRNWMARMAWKSSASGRANGCLPLASS